MQRYAFHSETLDELRGAIEMGLSIRRRWLWLFGTLALLGLLIYGVARSLDEPVRRYMETETNRRLTGYTIRIPMLRIRLWNASVEVRGASLVQDANPDPPMVHMERFVTDGALRDGPGLARPAPPAR